MTNANWLAIHTFLLPFLAGVTLLMVICRLLMLWQKERTRHAAWFMLVYLSLFVLFLSRSLDLPLIPITVSYLMLSLSLIACNYYEWRDFIFFLRQKNAVFLGEPVPGAPVVHTLEALTEEKGKTAIEATAKMPPATHEPEVLVKEEKGD